MIEEESHSIKHEKCQAHLTKEKPDWAETDVNNTRDVLGRRHASHVVSSRSIETSHEAIALK